MTASKPTSSSNSMNIVLVDGANGYIGTHVVYALCKRGFSVRALIREEALEADEVLLQSFGAKVLRAPLEPTSQSSQEAFLGVHTVVHLIGSIAPKKGETLAQLHGGFAEKLVKICRKTGVSKIVMVTALGTDDGALSQYHRTKRLAEKNVEASGIEYAILRPSLVVGRLVGRRESKLIKRYRDIITSGRKRVPLIGGGKNQLQPVFVADLATAVAACVENPQLRGCRLEIGGPQVVTMRQLVEALMSQEGKDLRIAEVPPFVVRPLAKLLEKIMEVPLVTSDQVVLSSIDNICDRNDLVETLKINARSLKEALSSYSDSSMLNDWTKSLEGSGSFRPDVEEAVNP